VGSSDPHNAPKYNWILEFVERQPQKKGSCKHYAMIRADSVFQCEPCANKQWGSAWGWVSIWYKFDRATRSGVVYLRIFGQQCGQCASATEERGRVYAGAIWDQNEIDDTWNVFRQEVESRIDAPVLPRRIEPPPTFRSMPPNWNTLFLEMFADFSQQVPSHSWGLVQVDRDLKGMKSLKGPFRKNTDAGRLFIWFGMGIKSRDRNSGKVFIRLLKPNRTTIQAADLAAWDVETVEIVLFAIYQKIGSTFYGRDIDQSFPQLDYVPPYWLVSKNSARHKGEFCQACHEGLCMNGKRNGMRTIIRNPSSKGPNVATWGNVAIIAED